MKIFKIGTNEYNKTDISTFVGAFQVDSFNYKYKVINGILYEKLEDGKLALKEIPPAMSGTVYLSDDVSVVKCSITNRVEMLIGNEVRKIENLNCTELKRVIFPKVNWISMETFKHSKLEYLAIESSVKIGCLAFDDCTQMKSLYTVPNGFVENISIEADAFRDCTGLMEVLLNCTKSLKINKYTFENCANLKKVVLRNIKYIPYKAFEKCKRIEEILLPEGCIVENHAFEDCVKSNIRYLPDSKFNDDILNKT
ncbi:MAG: leucine-rich repeat protein [Clostridia bacterium]|nr:leucine-rich repeat protein [Clostridia bacterium]